MTGVSFLTPSAVFIKVRTERHLWTSLTTPPLYQRVWLKTNICSSWNKPDDESFYQPRRKIPPNLSRTKKPEKIINCSVCRSQSGPAERRPLWLSQRRRGLTTSGSGSRAGREGVASLNVCVAPTQSVSLPPLLIPASQTGLLASLRTKETVPSPNTNHFLPPATRSEGAPLSLPDSLTVWPLWHDGNFYFYFLEPLNRFKVSIGTGQQNI